MTYIVTTSDDGDPDNGRTEIVSEEEAQDMTAEFFAAQDGPDGASITIRRAGYMGGSRVRVGRGPSGTQYGNGNVQVNSFTQSVTAGGDVYQAGRNLTVIKGGRS